MWIPVAGWCRQVPSHLLWCVVIAGGPQTETELEVFQFVHDGIQKGAIGVNLGRNIWQNEHPIAMIRAIRAIVHDNATPEQAQEIYDTVKNE